jgi:glycosyltransferase involved in cell wall biosynthesis
MLEVNYLRFVASAVCDRGVFRRLWRQALWRLVLLARRGDGPASAALAFAPQAALLPAHCAPGVEPEAEFLALVSGDVAVFSGRSASGRARVLVASPYLPFPLSHGGAVRMYNLMRRAAAQFDQVLVAFCDRLETPPAEVLEICAEVVLVRRRGSHSLPRTKRPEVVEEFSSASFRAALRQTIRKWQPDLAQLEFTQMAQYAADCAPARTLLVEHDITFELYEQLLAIGDEWDLRRQAVRWRRFETAWWRAVDCVITMSEKDRGMVRGARAECLPNGVDLERFRPGAGEPDAGRLLFIGSFAHLPNLLALEFFLRDVWPHLSDVRLHVIAGARHEYFLRRSRDRAHVDLEQPGIELEGFVADVRPAYKRATLVIAPLVASAGTNIKILEALAMGKAVVSTPAGVNGLDLRAGEDYVEAATAPLMATEIIRLLGDGNARHRLETAGRKRVERDYGWDSIARRQTSVYRSLM